MSDVVVERLARIESKLDGIKDDINRTQVEVGALQERSTVCREDVLSRISSATADGRKAIYRLSLIIIAVASTGGAVGGLIGKLLGVL